MDKTQTIYRVQNNNGEGPYAADDESTERQDMINRHENSATIHPSPENDDDISRSMTDSAEKCGFDSMIQLRDWFSQEELDMLEDDDFFVFEIHNAHITAKSIHQILYIPDKEWQYRCN